jgi:hypothetical protein
VQSVSLARLDRQTEQRGVRGIGGERANRDRIRHIEAVVLQDHGGTGLGGVASVTGKGPYLPAFPVFGRKWDQPAIRPIRGTSDGRQEPSKPEFEPPVRDC